LNSPKKKVVEIVIEQLEYLSRYGKTNKIAEKVFDLGKDKFGLEQLKYLARYGKTDKIKNEAENLSNLKTNSFNIEDYL